MTPERPPDQTSERPPVPTVRVRAASVAKLVFIVTFYFAICVIVILAIIGARS